jgi:hypothetical protein
VQPLTPRALLCVWEEGRARPLPERALLLLASACPDEPHDALAALPIGRRDARLLTLREWTFGSAFAGVTRCPACREHVDLSFTGAEVRAGSVAAADCALAVAEAGYEVTFRLPNSSDLAALDGPDPAAARRDLLGRCLLAARRKGNACSVSRLPARVLSAVVRRMADADPQADIHTAVSCPACAHAWRATFDIVSFFWTEIEAWARRLLSDVHVLAAAYSWSEADILALSPLRRRYYLEMVHA